MVTKWYEVSCDNCGCGITHVRSVSKEELRAYGVVVSGKKHFCSSECLREFKLRAKVGNSKER